MKYIITLTTAILTLPAPVHAAVTNFRSLVSVFVGVLNTALVAIFALIFLYVAWTLVNSWVLHGDDPKARKKGTSAVIAGVIGLVVLVSLWGLVALVRSVLG